MIARRTFIKGASMLALAASTPACTFGRALPSTCRIPPGPSRQSSRCRRAHATPELDGFDTIRKV